MYSGTRGPGTLVVTVWTSGCGALNAARDPVGDLTVLVLAADRDRHQGADNQPVGQRTTRLKQVTERAGDRCEQDVIDGAAMQAPDLLYVAEAGRGPGPAPVRADSAVQEAGRRLGQPARAAGQPPAEAEPLGRRAQ